MRIDREAFLIAVAALAGCEQGAPPAPKPAPITVMPPAIAAKLRELLAPEPVAPRPVEPAPIVVNAPIARPHPRTPKQWFHGLTMGQRENVMGACAVHAQSACEAYLQKLLPPARPRDDDGDGSPVPERVAVVVPPVAPLAGLPHDKVDAYCKENFPPPSCETPLVIAFDSQPIEFAAAGSAQFAFVPGAPMATDWPTAVTPWIALDLDGDGRITSGAELFGSSTVLPGGGLASNGFLALGALDANRDGVLDARDPMFAKLVLWSDRDGDHQSSPDELRPLSSAVTAISLSYLRDVRCDERDDCEGERGTLHWRDPAGAEHVGAVVDVYVSSRPRR